MVLGKLGFQNWLKLCFGSMFFLLFWQPQAIASLVTQTETKLLLGLPSIEPPAVPPLGDAETFLPSVPITTRLVVKLGDRRLYVYQDEELKTSYPIAVGKANWETPTGTFQVIKMIRNPAWQHPFSGEVIPPGADNPLGSRWIGFWTDGHSEIGFHGTPNESLIGQAVSHGCIRMRNQDVQALFELVKPGTSVVVQP